jgi:hypothetical protein
MYPVDRRKDLILLADRFHLDMLEICSKVISALSFLQWRRMPKAFALLAF